MDFLRQLLRGLREAWRQLSLSARINLGLAGLAVAALVLFVVLTSAQPQYVTLSTNLEADQTTSITSALAEANIAYDLVDANKTVRVPLAQRSEAMLVLAESDLPVGRGGMAPGFEIFSETELMTNQWLQNVKFMRAVQGELQRTLNAFDFVEYSQVLIREAQEELFVQEQKPSEAHVTLKTTRPLTPREVKGIVRIIANAGGPNLHPGNITLATTDGTFLHLPPETQYAALATEKLEMLVEHEKQREAKVERLLRDMGVRGTVTVSAKMSFDEKEVTDEEVLEGAEVSTFTMSTNIESTEQPPEGAPGTFTNLPEGAAAPGGTSTTEETTEEIINYEPSRRVTRTRTEPGEVVKYVVNLMVEGDYETDAEGNRTYAGLSEDRRQGFIDLAKAAVGEGEVATEVTLHDYPFEIDVAAGQQAAEQLVAAERWESMLQYAWYAVQILAIILGFVLIRMALRRAIQPPPVAPAEVEEVRELDEAARDRLRQQEIAREIDDLAAADPGAVAALLRSWLADEEP